MKIDRRAALAHSAALGLSLPAMPLWAQTADQKSSTEAKPKPARKPVDPYADAILVNGPPPLPAAGSFTIVVLPDTQHYSENFPDHLIAQTRWILEQRKLRNIACVLQLGDITNRNTHAEWCNADRALSELDGEVPYFLTLGNHDYSTGGVCADRTTLFNEYFPLERFRNRPTFGGVYHREPERMENSFHRFEAAGRKFLVVSLEFGPRREVVRWATDVARQHPDHEAILITHAYMYFDDTRYHWFKYGPKQAWNPHAYRVAKATGHNISDGEELWVGLVSRTPNFILTLNGHVLGDGLGRTVTSTAAGRAIPQALVNFQMKPNGGDGWLRLLEFRADRTTVEVADYSPTRNQRNESRQNRFTLRLPPIG